MLGDAVVYNMIEQGQVQDLAQFDQLTIERDANRAFSHFTEGLLTFLPTYQFIPGTNLYDRRPDKKLRCPAWCDRVLWRVSPTSRSYSGVGVGDRTSMNTCSGRSRVINLDCVGDIRGRGGSGNEEAEEEEEEGSGSDEDTEDTGKGGGEGGGSLSRDETVVINTSTPVSSDLRQSSDEGVQGRGQGAILMGEVSMYFFLFPLFFLYLHFVSHKINIL